MKNLKRSLILTLLLNVSAIGFANAQDVPEVPLLPKVEAGQPAPFSGWLFTDRQVVEMQNALVAAKSLEQRAELKDLRIEGLKDLISTLETRLANEAAWRAQALALTEDYKKLGGSNMVEMIIVGAAAFTGGYWFNEIASGGDTNINVEPLSGNLGEFFDDNAFNFEVP